MKIVGGHHCLSFLTDASRWLFVWLCLLNYSLFISFFFFFVFFFDRAFLSCPNFLKISPTLGKSTLRVVWKRELGWLEGSLSLIIRFFMIHTLISFLSNNKFSVWSWLDSGYTRSNSQVSKRRKVKNELNQFVDALAKFSAILFSNYVYIWWRTCWLLIKPSIFEVELFIINLYHRWFIKNKIKKYISLFYLSSYTRGFIYFSLAKKEKTISLVFFFFF